MALAPLAHVLWTQVMSYDPSDPEWPDRDRFVLSCGHACILLYSMLYLTGYGVELEDLRRFRQLHSRTPGHPEIHDLPGIEVTTGPLGQGFANGVGLGLAERMLRARFGPEVVDHYTFVVCSDGDLMEGISHEAASLAGHLGLGRLIYVYDDNHITIDGPTELTLSDDAAMRFEAYGWHVDRLGEVANDTAAIEAALRRAKAVEDRPSLLILRSHIGWPAPHRPTARGPRLAARRGRGAGDQGDPGSAARRDVLGAHDVLASIARPSPGARRRERLGERLAAWGGSRDWDADLGNQGFAGWQTSCRSGGRASKIATRQAINAALNALATKSRAWSRAART